MRSPLEKRGAVLTAFLFVFLSAIRIRKNYTNITRIIIYFINKVINIC